ncbi:MAG: hypothetical protein WAO00_01375 [Chthoniobacterales bacterium]
MRTTVVAKFQEARERRDRAEAEMHAIAEMVERIEAKLDALKVIEPPDLTLSGRVKKGNSERLIKLFLQAKNSSGASMKEVMESAHTKYGTTRRVLKAFIDSGKVVEKDGLFRWSAKDLSATKENGASPVTSNDDDGPLF